MYLNCHTYYSLRYGTLSPEQLVLAAKEHGISRLALTDINNTSCAYEFVTRCKEHDIEPILGIEFRRDNKLLYVGLAANLEGWRELNALLTDCSLDGEPLPDIAPRFNHAFIIYRSIPKPLSEFRLNEFYGIAPEDVPSLFTSSLKNHPAKLIAFNPVTFLDEDGFRTHKLLRCIDLNIVLSKLRGRDCARKTEMFYPVELLHKAYKAYPHIIRNTERVINACSIELISSFDNNRQTFTGSRAGDITLLRKLATEGCKRRYAPDNKEAYNRTGRELKVIERLGFAPYFLITWDIVRYAQNAGYHYVGRGSGANSIVAFCLHITDVDPLELDLYFERFINPYRSSPPDFDIDFSWDERDDVTDYIFKRYGREHTALLATYSTFKGKSIIRELGKVFGLPKADIDIIVEQPLADEKHHAFAKYIFHYGKKIEGFPNYLSIHAGGIVVSEDPINYYTALQLMPKGFPITHFDMYHGEDLGFHKYDILSQRGLGHIKDAVDLIRENKGSAVDIHDVARIKEDTRVRTQLRSGNCIGCFYIESPAMRGLLKKLRCDDYLHLVAASSIIRPGVAKSGMMREYIRRFHHPDSYEYLHPVFEEHLGETYGVMVYQEDVMKIVHHFAGLGMDEADMLRRIMSGKKKTSDAFMRLHNQYFANCRERGYSEDLTKEVWRQIESFSGYSFCKAHSASYAVESFQSLYLKAYHPLEFMVAVINNFGGFYYAELYVHEARMHGARIEAPCVNHSRNLTHIYGDTIFIGFIHIRELEKKVVQHIVGERMRGGAYRSLDDFVSRIDISRDQLEILIRINAFRFTGMNKYALMWEKNAVHNPAIKHYNMPAFFKDGTEDFELPELEEEPFEQAFDEIELLGFPLCSPFDLLADECKEDIFAREMENRIGRTVNMLGYYITRKNVTTVNRRLMNFGTWIDREGQFFDTTHFPPSLVKSPFKGKGVYRIRGKIVDDFGFASMEVVEMEKLPWVSDPRY